MNQHAHKIIFNKRLGRMDVVSEIVSNQGKGSQTTGYSNGITTTLIKPLVFALMLTLGTAQILPVQAGTIVAETVSILTHRALPRVPLLGGLQGMVAGLVVAAIASSCVGFSSKGMEDASYGPADAPKAVLIASERSDFNLSFVPMAPTASKAMKHFLPLVCK